MEISSALKWLRTAALASFGGGIAAVVATAMDPNKYQFPRDFGTGKLWPYFFMGAGVAFAALLVKSPLGQSAMGAYKDSQRQLQENKEAIEKARADLKRGPPQE